MDFHCLHIWSNLPYASLLLSRFPARGIRQTWQKKAPDDRVVHVVAIMIAHLRWSVISQWDSTFGDTRYRYARGTWYTVALDVVRYVTLALQRATLRFVVAALGNIGEPATVLTCVEHRLIACSKKHCTPVLKRWTDLHLSRTAHCWQVIIWMYGKWSTTLKWPLLNIAFANWALKITEFYRFVLCLIGDQYQP